MAPSTGETGYHRAVSDDTTLRVAVAQYAVPADPDAARRRIEAAAAQAVAHGAGLLVLPETANAGFYPPLRPGVHADALFGAEPLQALARRYGLTIACGVVESRDGHTFDTLLVATSVGGIAARYDKIHLYAPLGEAECFTEGRSPTTVTVGAFTFGLTICNDIRFPELFRALLAMDVDGYIVAAAWPFPRVAHWHTLIRARAIENRAFVLAANYCGTVSDTTFCGGSAVIDAMGVARAAAGDSDEELLIADLDHEELRATRARFPDVRASRRPGTYEA
jgi:omega-amidase